MVIYGYSNDCEAKKYADANNITYKLINAHDHQPGEWIIIKEATEKNSGTKIQKCTICGELLNVEIIDIIHTHTYGDKWQSDETNHWHECTVCGEKADTAEHEFGEWVIDEKHLQNTEHALYANTLKVKLFLISIPMVRSGNLTKQITGTNALYAVTSLIQQSMTLKM